MEASVIQNSRRMATLWPPRYLSILYVSCGVDDDNDGAADFADPDVRVLYTNGRDDDGDGLIDEQGPGGTPCSGVTPCAPSSS